MSDHGEVAGDGQWGPPYLLYLGQAADDLAIKTARGLAFWRPEWCVGQHRHPDCRYTLGLPDMSFGQARGRFFGKWVSGIIFDIGFMMAGWTQKKQALHDMMAGALVVRK